MIRRAQQLKPRPAFLSHPRLRRASAISSYAVAAALEALGPEAEPTARPPERLGIILCVMSGCVNYSRRFYDEVLKDPATASPLVFPETVFNAPASHLAALLGATGINYTLVGDPGVFPQGLALGADWLIQGRVEGCLVIGAEEGDWLTADACRLFHRRLILGEGAGALYLKPKPEHGTPTRLSAVTDPHLFTREQSRRQATNAMRAQLPAPKPGELLVDGRVGVEQMDAAERIAWKDWQGDCVHPKTVLGEGLMAASAWQCVVAVEALKRGRCSAATVSVVGCNEQAIGARFEGNIVAAEVSPL
jgi:3-oxoacyl-(acyl-carrier-protein) synthase